MAEFSVGIVGLDAMGSALTRRLDEQGIGHTATDLNSRMLQAHLAQGGSAPAGSPFDLAQICDLVLIAETSDDTLRESVMGSIGLIHALRPGTIIVDLSDASPHVGPALARSLYSKGVNWIEATPVGSSAGRARWKAHPAHRRLGGRARTSNAGLACIRVEDLASRRDRIGAARQVARCGLHRRVNRALDRDDRTGEKARTRPGRCS